MPSGRTLVQQPDPAGGAIAGQSAVARSAAPNGFQAYVRQIGALLWKDLAIELRTKDVILSTLVFGLLALTIFVFSFDLRADSLLLVSPGVLWVAIIFAGTLGVGRAYSHERERGSMEGLLLCPVDRSAVYVAKMLTSLLYTLTAAIVLTLVFAAFFNVPILRLSVLAVVLLGVVGFTAVGTVFGAMAVNTRAREVMLPVLLFPVLVPLVIAAVKATGVLVDGQPWSSAQVWVNILAGFDVIYLVAGFMLYEFVIEDWG